MMLSIHTTAKLDGPNYRLKVSEDELLEGINSKIALIFHI